MALELVEGGTVEDGESRVEIPPYMTRELDRGEGVRGAGEGEFAGGLDRATGGDRK